MSNNELKITLNISDELLAKVVMAMKQNSNPLGIPPQLLAGLMVELWLHQKLPQGQANRRF